MRASSCNKSHHACGERCSSRLPVGSQHNRSALRAIRPLTAPSLGEKISDEGRKRVGGFTKSVGCIAGGILSLTFWIAGEERGGRWLLFSSFLPSGGRICGRERRRKKRRCSLAAPLPASIISASVELSVHGGLLYSFNSVCRPPGEERRGLSGGGSNLGLVTPCRTRSRDRRVSVRRRCSKDKVVSTLNSATSCSATSFPPWPLPPSLR